MLKGGASEAGSLCGNRGATASQIAKSDVEALTPFAQQIGRGNFAVLERVGAGVERKHQKYGLPYQDIYLNDWSEHHIQAVSWDGKKEELNNLQYLLDVQHTPFTSWWNSRQKVLEKLVPK